MQNAFINLQEVLSKGYMQVEQLMQVVLHRLMYLINWMAWRLLCQYDSHERLFLSVQGNPAFSCRTAHGTWSA